MPFELRIALRYLRAQRRQLFIPVVSTISTLGVIVGVMLLLIALAIMTGMQGERSSRILGATSHLNIYRDSQAFEHYRAVIQALTAVNGIEGAAPALYGNAVISSGNGTGLVTLKGIDPEFEATVTDFGDKMLSGDLAALVAPADGNTDALPGLVLGDELAITLGVFTGDAVKVTSPDGHLSPFGMLPRTRSFRVVGIFRLGLYDYDNFWVLIYLPEAQRLLGLGDEVASVETRVTDLYDVKRLAAVVRTRLGIDYGTTDWMELNESLFWSFRLEKMVTAIFVGFIVAVAALNIVASQIMIVMNKTRDITILRSMGASPKSVMAIFMLQGAIIGVLGTAVGAVLGITTSWLLDYYQVVSMDEETYQVTYVPFQLLPADVFLVVLGAPLICLLATLYPARQAARLVITDALRFQ